MTQLDDHALLALREVGLHSAADLCWADLAALPPHSALSPAQLHRLQQGARVSLLGEPTQAQGQSGASLLRRRQNETPPRWTTTLTELDELLGGGIEAGEVVEVAGGRQSGRSSLVLYTILHHLLYHATRRVVFIHTTATFDAERCRQILHVLIDNGRAEGATFESEQGETLSTDKLAIRVLGRLAIVRPFTAQQALDGLVTELEKEGQGLAMLSMAVVDSVETLLGGEALTSPSAEGHATLVDFSRRLTTLARTHALTVFLINSASTSSTRIEPPITTLPLQANTKPTLGTTFTHMTDLTLWTTKAESIWGAGGQGKFIVEIARNRRGQARGWVGFDLADGVAMRPIE